MAETKKLLLVGWDSADWKIIRPLLAKGEMPMLAKILQRGAHGNLATIEPILSPMLWTSIATGKRAYAHGVHGFTEVDPASNQVVPVSAATRQCRMLWEILGERGLRSHVVGWFATHGERTPNVNIVSNLYAHAPRGEIRSPADWPPPPEGTYWPARLGDALNELRLHPTELDGDLLNLFVPRGAEIDQRKDRRLYPLAAHLAEAISIQAAATWLMENEPWNLTAVYFRAIDEISHEFMPFHAPKMDGVPPEDFEFYREVVNGAYRLHDLFLTRLVALAGEDAAVVIVSDHGFHSDHLRPVFTPSVPAGIVVWHRPQGIFAAAGPGFVTGEEIHGAGLLDVTPTLLRWFDLPRGRDMEGRVLHEAFTGPPQKNEIPTWENPAAQTSATLTRPRLSDEDNRLLLEQFVALGYIEAPEAQPNEMAESTQRENHWQLAQAYLHGGRPEEALPLLEEVLSAWPERVDYAQRLAQCQMQLGLLDEAEATLNAALARFTDAEGILLIRARIAQQRGDHGTALQHLEAIRALRPDDLRLWEQLAQTYLKLRRWDDCEAAAREVLAKDPEHAAAWVSIARCQVHRAENDAAVRSALEAVALQYGNAFAHLILGVALSGLGRWEEAAHALRNATILQPYLIPPHRFLAVALRHLGRREEAEQLMERARMMRRLHDFQAGQQLAQRRDRVAQRAAEQRKKAANERDKNAGASEGRPVDKAPRKILDLVIVSGLPRSGTSLMMQMLAAGGLPSLTDGQRGADESNPEGYFEWEEIKQLTQNSSLIDRAESHAVKVVSMLLGALPVMHRYKIIFMLRPLTEVVQSQRRMLERNGRAPQAEAAHLERTQGRHVDNVLEILRRTPQVDLLEIDFPALIAAPLEGARRVRDFLGVHLPAADLATMAAAVKPQLYRQRAG